MIVVSDRDNDQGHNRNSRTQPDAFCQTPLIMDSHNLSIEVLSFKVAYPPTHLGWVV